MRYFFALLFAFLMGFAPMSDDPGNEKQEPSIGKILTRDDGQQGGNPPCPPPCEG